MVEALLKKSSRCQSPPLASRTVVSPSAQPLMASSNAWNRGVAGHLPSANLQVSCCQLSLALQPDNHE